MDRTGRPASLPAAITMTSLRFAARAGSAEDAIADVADVAASLLPASAEDAVVLLGLRLSQ